MADVDCGEEGLFLSLEIVKLKQSSITNKPLKVSSAGGPWTLSEAWNGKHRGNWSRITVDGSLGDRQ